MKNALTGQIRNLNQEFRLGGLIIYHSFTLSQTKLPLKKSAIFVKIQWKVAIYAGCQNKFIVQHPAHFLLFLKDQPVKPRPHSQISFKSWLYNVGLELRFFLFKSMLWWLEKLVFRLFELKQLKQSENQLFKPPKHWF